MYAKSFMALDGNGRLTRRPRRMTATAAICVPVPCSTILNTTPNVRGLNIMQQSFRRTVDSTARM
ncbi:Uncharacterised protein [Citrobacter youngae]|uniref:Uncharacterized protein n=1 Tax=Citrobacter youngae TaxID=133448 RepID=A0ABN7GV68_9ENTR|nr:Uncharacterised protein [Citrobacter youngae]CAC9192751.1 Uncharacterised protein [Citrobacter youngae]